MKIFKQAKTPELEDGVDKISNLPDHVLQLILSHIPTTEEVNRTSILSRRWRYLWTSIPSIDVDYTRGLDPPKGFEGNGFKEFVYWVLLHKSLDLDSFRLRSADYYDMLTIRQWIHAAVTRKVKLLDLMFRLTDKSRTFELPHCLVTCGSLEVLRLCLIGRDLNLPKFTGFPALRVLELNDLNLNNDDNIVKHFLESCPMLEDLRLIDCRAESLVISCPKLKYLRIDTRLEASDEKFLDYHLELHYRTSLTLEISCPKLEFLRLIGYVASYFLFQNLYSLKKAVIHTKDLSLWEAPAIDFFATISHVESLSISLRCIIKGRCPYYISLPNLKTLELILNAFLMDSLITFLTRLRDLDSLHLIIPKDIHHVYMRSLEEAGPMSILTRHLKKVEFLDFDGDKSKLVLARLLLEHGNGLEEMVFSWVDEAKFHERSMETMNQVSNFHKASLTVKLTAVFDPSQANSRDRPQMKMIRPKWSQGA